MVSESRFLPSNSTMASCGAGVRWQLPATCVGWGRSESWTCHSVPGITGVFLKPNFLPAACVLSAVRQRRLVASSFFKVLSLILGSFHWACFVSVCGAIKGRYNFLWRYEPLPTCRLDKQCFSFPRSVGSDSHDPLKGRWINFWTHVYSFTYLFTYALCLIKLVRMNNRDYNNDIKIFFTDEYSVKVFEHLFIDINTFCRGGHFMHWCQWLADCMRQATSI